MKRGKRKPKRRKAKGQGDEKGKKEKKDWEKRKEGKKPVSEKGTREKADFWTLPLVYYLGKKYTAT